MFAVESRAHRDRGRRTDRVFRAGRLARTLALAGPALALGLAACMPPAGAPAPVDSFGSAELADNLDQYKPQSKLGKGFTDYDEFRKTRVFGWRDVIVVTEDDKRMFYLDFAVVTQSDGEPVGADELAATVRFRWLPEEPDRYDSCSSLDFIVGDDPLSVPDTTPSNSHLVAVVALRDLAAMAAAPRLSGRLCRDVFSFSPGQMRELRKFWRGLRTQLGGRLPERSWPALATDPDRAPRARERAAEAFRRGVDAYRAGRYEPACEEFARATVLAPQVFGPWVGLATCAEKLGRTATALRSCNRALTLLIQEDAAAARSQEQQCRDLNARVRDRVSTLRFEHGGAVARGDVRLLINGQLFELPTAGQGIQLDPGSTTLVVTVKGAVWLTRELKLKPGQELTVSIPRTPESRDQAKPGAPGRGR